jgi:DNA-binding transcriptional ArsR family regulator
MLRDYAAVLKAAADPSRARILKMLESGEMCVCQIVATLDLSQSTVSKHLSLLHAAGLIEQRKVGRWVHVRLAGAPRNEYALPVLGLLRAWLSKDPAVRDDTKRARQVRRMPAEQVCAWCECRRAGKAESAR